MAARYPSPTPTDKGDPDEKTVETASYSSAISSDHTGPEGQLKAVSYPSPLHLDHAGSIEGLFESVSLDRRISTAVAARFDSQRQPYPVTYNVRGNLSVVHGQQTNFESGSSQTNIDNQNYTPPSASQTGMSQDKSPSKFNLEKCQEELKEFYKDEMGKVQLLPWGREPSDTADMKSIFVDLELIQKETAIPHQRSSNENQKLNSNEDLVNLETNQGHRSKRVLVMGEGGSGKSTLLANIAYKWALSDSQPPSLSQYHLVFIIGMHEIQDKNASLVDLIFQQILPKDTKVSNEGLKEYIISHQEDILLLVDGLDEDSSGILANKSGEVAEILSRKRLRKSCVILSTRSHRVKDLGEYQTNYTQVKLTGFSKENIMLYIHKFMHDTGKSEKLVEKLDQEPHIMAMAATPVLLLMICLLWQDQCSLPDTKTKLYKDTMKYLWQRYENKITERPFDDDEKDNDEMQNDLRILLIQLGEVAVDGSISRGGKVVFNQSDFDIKVYKLACQVGLINRERLRSKLKVNNFVTFLHKSIQDFCSALYLANLFDTNKPEFDKKLTVAIVANDKRDVSYNGLLIALCCGINTKLTPVIISCFVDNASKFHKTWLDITFHLHCILESQFTYKECCELVPLYSCVDRIGLVIDNILDIPCVLYQLKQMQSSAAKPSHLFTNLSMLLVNSECTPWLHSLLQYTKNLKCIDIRQSSNLFRLKANAISFFEAIVGLQHITQLWVARAREGTRSDDLDITKGLDILLSQTRRNQFTTLVLSGFIFNCQVMAKLVVRSNSSLKCLTLNAAEQMQGKEIVKVLPDLKQLEELFLQDVKITAIRPLKSIVGHIQRLGLINSELGDSNMRELFSILKRAKKLSLLDLASNRLSIQAMEALVRCLNHNPQLKHLGLHDTNLNDESAIMVASCLKEMPNVQTLNVTGNPDIGSNGKAALTDPDLTKTLNIYWNHRDWKNEAYREFLRLWW